MKLARELAVARDAAVAAGQLQLDLQPTIGTVILKEDRSPVTAVDRRCEELVRTRLLDRFPDDGFCGEESGVVTGTSGRRWIVDPLDGTRPYIRAIPTHSTLIALAEGDDLLVGVIHLPGLGETYWASRGNGAFCNDRSLQVSTTADLAGVTGSGLGHIQLADQPAGAALLALQRHWDYAYGFMDAYSYGSVAAGRLDICVSLLDKPWDCAAGACIVAEAGGRYSDLQGRARIDSGTMVVTNGILHDQVLEWFAHL